MISFVAHRLRLAVDMLLHGPAVETPVERPLRPVGDPWAHDENAEVRRLAALSVLDEDVVGFFLLRFLAGDVDLRCNLDVAYVVEKNWWPAVCDRLVSQIVGDVE